MSNEDNKQSLLEGELNEAAVNSSENNLQANLGFPQQPTSEEVISGMQNAIAVMKEMHAAAARISGRYEDDNPIRYAMALQMADGFTAQLNDTRIKMATEILFKKLGNNAAVANALLKFAEDFEAEEKVEAPTSEPTSEASGTAIASSENDS